MAANAAHALRLARRGAGAVSARVALVAGALVACTRAEAPAAPRDAGSGSGGVSSGGAGAASSGGSGSSGGSTSSSGGSGAGGAGGTGGTPCTLPGPHVGKVPEGWVPYTDFSCDLPFYVPPDASLLPAPIEWAPCAASLGLPGCSAMLVTWPHGYYGAYGQRLLARSDGPPLLLFNRSSEPDNWSVVLVAEPDGSVRDAIGTDRMPPQGLWIGPQDLSSTHWALSASGGITGSQHADDSGRIALLLGEIGSLRPRVLFRQDGVRFTPNWYLSSQWLLHAEVGRYTLLAMPTPESAAPVPFASSATDPDGLRPSFPVLSGPDAFAVAAGGVWSKLVSYTPSAGTRDLVRFDGYTDGDYSVGTDGVDLVWTHGSQHGPVEGNYPVRDVMTARYTTDPAALAPRRLRSDPRVGRAEGWQVGCGYAAHGGAPDRDGLIVRLSDGFAWQLPGSQDATWTLALGVTCDDAYFNFSGRDDTVAGGLSTTIVRVHLSSLGPGTPPE